MSIIFFVSCDLDSNDPMNQINHSFDFGKIGKENWKSFFSDYPKGEETFYELEFKHINLPEPLDTKQKGLKISGNNHSDDLFSAIYRKFGGLLPNTNYKVYFDIDFASDTPINAVGVGGDPNLKLGAGGINFEPKNTVDNSGHYRPNFESKLQSGESNNVFKVIGDIGVSETIPTPFKLINRNNLTEPLILKTNAKGELWIMIATDSGFEATTTLIYTKINILFKSK